VALFVYSHSLNPDAFISTKQAELMSCALLTNGKTDLQFEWVAVR